MLQHFLFTIFCIISCMMLTLQSDTEIPPCWGDADETTDKEPAVTKHDANESFTAQNQQYIIFSPHLSCQHTRGKGLL